MAGMLQFIEETVGFNGELKEVHTDAQGNILASYTELPPSGLQAMIAGVSGSVVTEVVPFYDSDGFITGYADKETRKPVTLIDGPYKFSG